MKPRDLATTWWRRLKQVNACTAKVFPPVVAGFLFLLFVYLGVERQGGYESLSGWSGFIPRWLTLGMLIAFLAIAVVAVAYFTYQQASRHPTVANGSTAIGIAITTTLSWATEQCNWTGGVVAGLTAAGAIAIVATVIEYVTGRIQPGTAEQQPIEKPLEGKEGLISAMRIGVAIFMGLVGLIAVSFEEFSSPTRSLLLVFAGVGLTSAATVTSQHSLKNYMVIAGMIVSLVGGYMQLDQAITAAGNESVSALDIVIAVTILAFAPFTYLAAQRHRILRILFVPALAAAIVLFIMILVTMIPAIIIVFGCNAGEGLQVIAIGVASTIAFAAGVATFVIVTLALILRKRENQDIIC